VNLYYDLADRPMKTVENYTSGLTRSFQYTYDMDNCLTQFLELFGTTQYKTVLEYDKDNRITAVSYNPANDPPTSGTQNVRYHYDTLGRMDMRTLDIGTTYDYTLNYRFVASSYSPSGATTGMIAGIDYKKDNLLQSSLDYTYDACGRILTVSNGTWTIHYTYDGLGQLLRTDDPTDTRGGGTGSHGHMHMM